MSFMLAKLKPSPLNSLLTAQFLSAFVDNMILFITLAIIKKHSYPDYYLPLVQSAFLFSYIVLAPWVGKYADKNPKSSVLIIGNILKSVGIVMLLFNINPALSYAVVGIGAVVYSPAKYGLLPELTSGETQLLKANSQIESFTILAILTGSVVGGFLSDKSIFLSLITCLALYGFSIIFNTFIPKKVGNMQIAYRNSISEFFTDTMTLFKNEDGRFSLIGTGSFWLASAVLRMVIIAWLPITLGITSNTHISLIIAVTGIGIAVGAAITPYLVTVKTYTRTVYYGLAMALCIFAFTIIHNLPLTVLFLLLTGSMGGIYIVPMNTCLQQVGHASIGTGKTIAIQNLTENMFMLAGVGAYTLAVKTHVQVNTSISATGITLLLIIAWMYWQRRASNARNVRNTSN